MRLKSNLPAALKYEAVVIESAAREAGLDFFDVVFELLGWLGERDLTAAAALTVALASDYPELGGDYARRLLVAVPRPKILAVFSSQASQLKTATRLMIPIPATISGSATSKMC